MRELSECRFTVACDVKNPLCGENGCSAVFAPQKGATPEAVRLMDGWLARYAALTEKAVGQDFSAYEGSGAAGGLGFAFLAYLNATLRSGAQTVIEATALEEKIRNADVLVTGEGRLDFQSFMGKAPVEAARLAKKYGKKVIALAGSVSDSASLTEEFVIDAFFPIVGGPCTLAEAMDKENARRNMKRAAEQAFRLLRAFE
jgi:glycerate kinase